MSEQQVLTIMLNRGSIVSVADSAATTLLEASATQPSSMLTGMYHNFVGGSIVWCFSSAKIKQNVELIAAKHLDDNYMLSLSTESLSTVAITTQSAIMDPANWWPRQAIAMPIADCDVVVKGVGPDAFSVAIFYTEANTSFDGDGYKIGFPQGESGDERYV